MRKDGIMNLDSLKVNLQYFLPKYLLTRLVGLLADAKLGRITTEAIKLFVRVYGVNMDEAADKIEDFATFNEFFSRALKEKARPIDGADESLVFPADGKISQFGDLSGNFQLQAKNHYFTTEALLGNRDDAAHFTDGKFITVYLSPKDYHRVHLPISGKLLKMTYIPGMLFSVNPLYTANIPELFSRNERVVCLFETPIGKMALVFVGAAIVRSVATQWAGIVRSAEISTRTYENENISFAKGAEIGKFLMGSTVICLFEKNKIDFSDGLECEQTTRVGQKMAVTTGAGKTVTKKNKSPAKTIAKTAKKTAKSGNKK